MNYVVFHPHYLIQLDSSENHKSQPWQMPFGDLETAAVLNHLEMTYNLYLTVALYFKVYPGVNAQRFSTICNHYVNYVTAKHYDAVVVFLWL